MFKMIESVKDATGLPWGCVVRLLASLENFRPAPHSTVPDAKSIVTCEQCGAAINPYVTFSGHSKWKCPLCKVAYLRSLRRCTTNYSANVA